VGVIKFAPTFFNLQKINTMTKQTAVEYLVQNIEIALKLNGVELNHMYRMKTIYPVYNQAKAMEKEQLENAYDDGVSEGEMRGEYDDENEDRFDSYTSSTTYYNQTYGGDK